MGSVLFSFAYLRTSFAGSVEDDKDPHTRQLEAIENLAVALNTEL